MSMKIFACGLDDKFQLNIPADANSKEGFPIVNCPSPLRFSSSHLVKISAGEYHTVFLFDNGQVYAAGSDLNFRIGGPARTQYDVITNVNINNEKVKDVHCGRQYTAYLTVTGKIVICSSKFVGSQIIVSLNKNIVRLSGNDDEPCAIDEFGRIFLFDENPNKMPKKFRLKKERTYSSSSQNNSPRDSLFLRGSRAQSRFDIEDILNSSPKKSRSKSVSRAKKGVKSKTPHLSSKTKQKNDKTEDEDNENENDEQIEDQVSTEYVEAVEIARGSGFTLALAKDGTVYGNGRIIKNICTNQTRNTSLPLCSKFSLRLPNISTIENSHPDQNEGQQQRRRHKQSCSFETVETLRRKKCRKVFANQNHAAVLTYDGKVYMWGDGSAGQLGNGSKEDNEDFEYLKIGDNKKVVSISLGLWHSVFVTDDGEVYSAGENTCGQVGMRSKSRLLVPTLVDTIPQKVSDVSCGAYNTFLICKREKIY